MRKKTVIFGCVAVAILGFVIFLYLYVGSTVPPGQPPLVSVDSSNLVAFKAAFNSSANSVRILLMLSPT